MSPRLKWVTWLWLLGALLALGAAPANIGGQVASPVGPTVAVASASSEVAAALGRTNALTNGALKMPEAPPQVAPPPDESLRLALPVVAMLLFCVLGWYARRQSRKQAATALEARENASNAPPSRNSTEP